IEKRDSRLLGCEGFDHGRADAARASGNYDDAIAQAGIGSELAGGCHSVFDDTTASSSTRSETAAESGAKVYGGKGIRIQIPGSGHVNRRSFLKVAGTATTQAMMVGGLRAMTST